jgi:hypothetical protein
MLTVEQLCEVLREGSLVTRADARTLAERVHAAIAATQAPSEQQAGEAEQMASAMADFFCGWRLPDNFSPDAGITFKQYHPAAWPTGTNLFTHEQAKAMFRAAIDAAIAARKEG